MRAGPFNDCALVVCIHWRQYVRGYVSPRIRQSVGESYEYVYKIWKLLELTLELLSEFSIKQKNHLSYDLAIKTKITFSQPYRPTVVITTIFESGVVSLGQALNTIVMLHFSISAKNYQISINAVIISNDMVWNWLF